MSKGISFAIEPRMRTIKTGALLRTKKELTGTDALGIHEDDDDMEFGSNEVVVPKGTVCLFAEEHQFYGVDKTTPMSAWIRWRLIAGDKIIYYSLVSTRKRIWDFETYRGKQRIIRSAIDETFDIVKQGTSEEV